MKKEDTPNSEITVGITKEFYIQKLLSKEGFLRKTALDYSKNSSEENGSEWGMENGGERLRS
jgi:hypothetical protein